MHFSFRRSLICGLFVGATFVSSVAVAGAPADDPRQSLNSRMTEIRQTTVRESCKAYTKVMANQFGVSVAESMAETQNRFADEQDDNEFLGTENRKLALSQIRRNNPFEGMGNGQATQYLKQSYAAIAEDVEGGGRPNLDSFFQDCVRKMPQLMTFDRAAQQQRDQAKPGSQRNDNRVGQGGSDESSTQNEEDDNNSFRYLRR